MIPNQPKEQQSYTLDAVLALGAVLAFWENEKIRHSIKRLSNLIEALKENVEIDLIQKLKDKPGSEKIRVLSLGCGDGTGVIAFSTIFEQYGLSNFECIGIDNNEKLQQKWEEITLKYSNVHFIHGDATDLDLLKTYQNGIDIVYVGHPYLIPTGSVVDTSTNAFKKMLKESVPFLLKPEGIIVGGTFYQNEFVEFLNAAQTTSNTLAVILDESHELINVCCGEELFCIDEKFEILRAVDSDMIEPRLRAISRGRANNVDVESKVESSTFCSTYLVFSDKNIRQISVCKGNVEQLGGTLYDLRFFGALCPEPIDNNSEQQVESLTNPHEAQGDNRSKLSST
jgi:SAM-dependent methyltransferase